MLTGVFGEFLWYSQSVMKAHELMWKSGGHGQYGRDYGSRGVEYMEIDL